MRASGDLAAVQQMFADFARHSGRSAPLYGALATGIADDPVLAAPLLDASPGQRQPVLLFACVHALLLDGAVVDAAQNDAAHRSLAAHYPNLRAASPELGEPTGNPVNAFARFCAERSDSLAELLRTKRTQTNEVGRSALLLPALALVAETPFGHVDVGASAGLNLLLDRFEYRYLPDPPSGPDTVVGAGSRVVLTCGTRGEPPIPPHAPAARTRIGLDLEPIDPTDPAKARWLAACVWPDDTDRFARLTAALELAAAAKGAGEYSLVKGGAVDGVEGCIELMRDDEPAVVTTSWVLNYLSADERVAFVAELDAIGGRRDLAWVYAETSSLCPELPGAPTRQPGHTEPTAVVLVRWRDGRRTATHLADAHPHGRWMHWRPAGSDE